MIFSLHAHPRLTADVRPRPARVISASHAPRAAASDFTTPPDLPAQISDGAESSARVRAADREQ